MTTTLKKTVKIPANRRVSFALPKSFMPGQLVTFTVNPSVDHKTQHDKGPSPASMTQEEFEAGEPCPLCEYYGHIPNAETIAAIEEGRAMSRGEIPCKWYDTLEEMFQDLEN